MRLAAITTGDLQDLADRLLATGRDASTIRNTFMGLRALFRRALVRGEVAVNPTSGLQLPAVRGQRDRIATVMEADALLRALPELDRALWATAFYAGLRRGELMALTIEDTFTEEGVAPCITVTRAYDPQAREFIAPKSRAGVRSVPVTQELRGYLAAHKLQLGRSTGLLFGRTETMPFDDRPLQQRADRAWRRRGLSRITLQESRHTFASLMIAAGVNAKALSTYMGHASITITLDRYGHLMPGNESEAADLLHAYLASERTRAAGAQSGAH